jgi:hypothetical protein
LVAVTVALARHAAIAKIDRDIAAAAKDRAAAHASRHAPQDRGQDDGAPPS